MKKVVLKGHVNNKGGKVINPKQKKVFIDGKTISTTGDIVTYKNLPPTKTGKGTKVFINKISVNVVGNIDADGNIRTQGTQKVNIS